MVIVTSLFSRSPVFKILTVHTKTQYGVFKFIRFEERFFLKQRFRDGVSLTVEIKLRFARTKLPLSTSS